MRRFSTHIHHALKRETAFSARPSRLDFLDGGIKPGFDHKKLNWRHFGGDYRLTDVHGNVVKEILA